MPSKPFIVLLPSLLLWLLLMSSTTLIYALLEHDEWEQFDHPQSDHDGNNAAFVLEQQVNNFLRRRQSINATNETTPEDDIMNGDVITDPISYFVLLSNGCGGSLVHGDIVLTAAHCVDGSKPTSVRIGATTRTDGDYSEISDIRIMDCYSTETVGNDLAVIKLTNFSSNTPVRLNIDCNTPASCGAQVYAIGFGMIDDVTQSSVLRGVTLNTQALCEFVTPLYCNVQMVCANSQSAGTCAGDSGGPIVVAGTDLQIGINSFSNAGCESQTIDVYTRVSNYYNWIQDQICAMSSQPPAGCSSRRVDSSIQTRVARFTRTTAALAVGSLWKSLAMVKRGILRDNDSSSYKRYYRRYQGQPRRRTRR